MSMYKDNYIEELERTVQDLEEELSELHKYASKLEQANTSMMSLIHINDQKQALMEESSEFKEAIEKLYGQHELSAVGDRPENTGTAEEVKTSS